MEKEAQLQAAALGREWARTLLTNFARWLWSRSPHDPGLNKDYMTCAYFIQRLDATYTHREDISAVTLLADFGSKTLRKHLLVTQFLQEEIGVAVPQGLRSASSDAELIEETLRTNAALPWGPLLARYNESLNQTRVSIRTRRMYMRAALSICKTETLSLDKPVLPARLTAFLKKHPGARANVARFVGFCQRTLGWSIEMPPPVRATEAQHKKSAERVLAISLSAAKKIGFENASFSELTSIMSSAFAIEESAIRTASLSVDHDSKEMTLHHHHEQTTIPPEMAEIAKNWMKKKPV